MVHNRQDVNTDKTQRQSLSITQQPPPPTNVLL